MIKNNILKHISSVPIFIMISLVYIIIGNPLLVFADVQEGDILNHNKVTIPQSTDVASSKYSVIAKFTKGKTRLELEGVNGLIEIADLENSAAPNKEIILNAPENRKNKIKALYKNVGTYEGRSLDFEWTVTDWQKAGFGDNPNKLESKHAGENMYFYPTRIGFRQSGYDWVDLKGLYKYSDTGEIAKITGSYMTVHDLDANQFMSFSPSMMNKIDKIYVYKNTRVSLWKDTASSSVPANRWTNIGARFYEDIHDDDKQGFVTFLVSGHELNFRWSKDWSRPASTGNYYNMKNTLNWRRQSMVQYFGYRSEKPVRTETLTPSKRVIDKKGNAVIENEINASETFNYEIYHTVPNEYPEFFYKKYEMKDQVDKALDIKNVKIYNDSNKDISNKFNINIKDNLITASAKEINTISFYETDYKFVISAKVKNPEDLIWITEGNSTYKLTNKASITINNETKNTNTVTTTIKYNPEDLYIERCYVGNLKPETIQGITKNHVSVTKGYFPSNAPDFDIKYSENTNESHNMLEDKNKRPQKGWTESEWITWKDKFVSGSLTTNSVDLSNITEIIQKYGGILNVTRTHYFSEINIQLCQNQQRIPNFSKNEWEWKNKGGKFIHEVKEIKYNTSNEKDSYQILGVNCNVDGVERVKNDFKKDFDIEDHSYDLNNKASRLIIVKPKNKGTPFPLGANSHYTSKDVFYNPDGATWRNSCELDFSNACKSAKLSSGANDAKNNISGEKGNSKTFSKTEFINNDEVGYSLPNENNQLMFFRDNEDRQVRADVWYLDINNKTYSSDKNSSAKMTDVRAFGGSPEISITDIEPWDNNGKSSKVNQINKDFSFNQHVNRLNIKSKWSSSNNNPYKVGLMWTYVAKAINVGFSEIDGYGGGSKVTNDYEFDVGCAFHNNPGNYQAVVPRGNIFSNGTINPNDKWKYSETMEIVFTRSISVNRIIDLN